LQGIAAGQAAAESYALGPELEDFAHELLHREQIDKF
jgi:hypothetical protein